MFNRTQKEAVNWLKAQRGKLLPWGGYSQCVAFVRNYLNYLGSAQPAGVNGAKDLWRVVWPSGWTRYSSPQVGDVVVWNAIPSNRWGHVGVVVEVHGAYIVTADQNFTNPKTGTQGSPITVANKWAWPNSRALGFWRPSLKVPQAAKHPFGHLVGRTIQLRPKNGSWRFYRPNTDTVATTMRDDGALYYLVRDVSKRNNRVVVNSKQAGGLVDVPLATAAGKNYDGEYRILS